MAEQLFLDPAKQVFLDECGISTSMTRRYARATVGSRAYAFCPVNYGPNVTVVSAIRQDGVVAALQFDGAIDAQIFLAFLQEVLLPELRPGDNVWMDNLSSHKVEGVAELLASVGATARYLPPYSPDFNPIEMCISKFKEGVRARAPRTRKALDDAVTQSLDMITPEDTNACLRHCGYGQAMLTPL
jgi:transposase